MTALHDACGAIATYGLMDDGMTAYISGVNCLGCGKFVGRDGSIAVGYFEMSNEIAYVEGECGACLGDRTLNRDLMSDAERQLRVLL